MHIVYSSIIPLIGSRRQHYTFDNRNLKIIGFDQLKTGVTTLEQLWAKAASSDETRSIKQTLGRLIRAGKAKLDS